MFCTLLGQDIRCAFTGPLVLWFFSLSDSCPATHQKISRRLVDICKSYGDDLGIF